MAQSPWDALTVPFCSLLKGLHEGVLGARIVAPGGPLPASASEGRVVPLRDDGGRELGSLVLEVTPQTDFVQCLTRIQTGVDCIARTLASVGARERAQEMKLLRLAHELDFDFPDDSRLEEALAAVAARTGVELAWLASPRCYITLAARGNDSAADPGVAAEVTRMRERVTPLAGRVQKPLIINGATSREETSAQCRLLLVPLFVGRTRQKAWLVLANPLAAPPFGGWQVLAALTLGQALARRLEVDLDRRTGLFNHGGLEAALPRLSGNKGTLVLFDIDHLQAVNQMHGMAAGDAAILAFARLLAPPLVPGDALLGRAHGDQFIVVLPGVDAKSAAEVAKRLQKAARSIRPGRPDNDSPLTLSVGVVEVDDFRKPFERFAVDADIALKLAKDRGRGRVEVFSSVNSTLIRRSDAVIAAADLREALRNGALLLYAQPIRLLADPKAAPGFELLVRMRDEDGEILPPGEYISAAQKFQMLPDLDRYVIDAALKLLSPHRGLLARQSSSIAINVSGQSLADEKFVRHFIARLRASRIPASLITVEVTEQAAMTNLELAGRMMRKLRQEGCGIAIDDFGTGANSLAYLRSLPVTRLKIDGSFVRDLLTNRRSEAGVKGILQLAKEYRLDTVAEYVESEEVVQRLQLLGVKRGQGYLFGRPEPIELMLQKLEKAEQSGLEELLANG